MQKILCFNVECHTFGVRFDHLQTVLKLNVRSPYFIEIKGKRILKYRNIYAYVNCIRKMLDIKGSHDGKLGKENSIVMRWAEKSHAVSADFIIGFEDVKEMYEIPSICRKLIQNGFTQAIIHRDKLVPIIEPKYLNSIAVESEKKKTKDTENIEKMNWTIIDSHKMSCNFKDRISLSLSDGKKTGEVIIVPARTDEVCKKKVYFLFSITQIEDISRPLSLYKIPFAPSHVDGCCIWRDDIIPVISLERYLDLQPSINRESHRFLVIRFPAISPSGAQIARGAFIISPSINKLKIPTTSPLKTENYFSNPELFKGIFEWENKLICVVDMEKLMNDFGESELH